MKLQKQINSLIMVLACIFYMSTVQAQFEKLDSINGYQLKVYHSKGSGNRAKELAVLSHNAMVYNNQLLNFKPTVTLLVLSPVDWPLYTQFPAYGMPHYINNTTLVVASQDNPLWKGFIPPLEQLPPALATQIRKTYSKDGYLTMQPFFDLLALHELGHAYHQQGSLTMQRKWMGELFCNILLHTYIAENEPKYLPALTVFPNMVIASGTSGYPFTTLEQFENNYHEIGTKHPKNYGWYQSRLHAAAREIYDAGGKSVLPKLWKALQSKNTLDDQQLAEEMSKKVHSSVGDVMLKW
jgi:hypothetical protein